MRDGRCVGEGRTRQPIRLKQASLHETHLSSGKIPACRQQFRTVDRGRSAHEPSSARIASSTSSLNGSAKPASSRSSVFMSMLDRCKHERAGERREKRGSALAAEASLEPPNDALVERLDMACQVWREVHDLDVGELNRAGRRMAGRVVPEEEDLARGIGSDDVVV